MCETLLSGLRDIVGRYKVPAGPVGGLSTNEDPQG